jgi:ABC-type glycerol-3-phosphate transport system substrate-binding protein
MGIINLMDGHSFLKTLLQGFHTSIVFILLLGLLAGCGTPTLQPTPTAAPLQATATRPTVPATATIPPTSTLTSTPQPTGVVTLMGWGSVQDWLTSSGVLADFQRDYPGIRLEWINAGSAAIQASLSGSDGETNSSAVDLVFVDDENVANLVGTQAISDLSDWAGRYAGQFLEYKRLLLQNGGHLWALPIDSQPGALFYRRDVFRQAGLPDSPSTVDSLLSTWDGYLQACRQIYSRTKFACFSLTKANNDGRLLNLIAWQSGFGYYDTDGKPLLNSRELVHGLELFQSFWKEHLVSATQETTNDWYNQLADPKTPLATAIEPSGFASDLETWIAPDGSGQWGVVPIPALTAGQPRAVSLGGLNLALTTTSHQKAAAQAFMEYLLLRSESQRKLFQHAASIPAIQLAGQPIDPFIDPYYRQDLGELFRKIGIEIPTVQKTGADDLAIRAYLQQAMQRVSSGAISAQKALDDAQLMISGRMTATPTRTPVPAPSSTPIPDPG